MSFPFFDPEFLSAPRNDLPLWERMVRPDIDNLFFIGLLQPLGAIMPMAEGQAKFIGDHLTGRVMLPSASKMQSDIDKARRWHARPLTRCL